MERKRELIYFKNYFNKFFDLQTKKVKDKIDYVLFTITVAERIPVKFLKHITGIEGLFEIRIKYMNNIY